MDRREIIGGGLMGLTGLVAHPGAEAPAQRSNDNDGQVVAAAIDQLRAAFEHQFDACELGACREIAAIRSQQRLFLRANRKYPDFIEVGLDVWDRVYDFHVKHQQPITAQRLSDGRYTMVFMFTNLLLRVDQALDYVGIGFDER